jgi:hypothetical protein
MATINNIHILNEKDLVVNNEHDVNITLMNLLDGKRTIMRIRIIKKSNWLVLTTCKNLVY